jgi:uroporphyrinogen-III synthase
MEENRGMRHDGPVIANPKKGFQGLRVLSLESRRAPEMAKLIAAYGGAATVAPSMREGPLESNTEALAFIRRLLEGDFDSVVLLTGVGVRALGRVVETAYPLEKFIAALKKVKIVARGPKPLAVLNEWAVPVTLAAPEPNTWREILRVLDENSKAVPLQGSKVAVQEYGEPNQDLLAGLAQRGAHVTSVPVYEWGMPEDTGPLRAAIAAVARNEMDVVLFTAAMQASHLLQVAAQVQQEDALRRAFSRVMIASIGPVTSERIRDLGLHVDMEPSHPKMGYLVSEAALLSAEIVRGKRISEP